METINTSTLPKLYNYWKEKYPDKLLLFLVDGFYVAHEQDIDICKKVLGVTRFPQNGLSTQLRKLIKSGLRVGVCEPIKERKIITIKQIIIC